jgi:hypothetical protein
MPLYHVSGWNRVSARQDSWYVNAASAELVRSRSYGAGFIDPRIEACSAAPPGADVITIGRRRRPHRLSGLVWRVAVGSMLGVLAANLIMALIRT